MYRIYSTAVNKTQWNSAPSTHGGVRECESLVRRNSYQLTSWPALQTASSLLPGVRVGLLCEPPEAHISAVGILTPNMLYLRSPLSHLRESLPLRRGLQTMFRNRWEWIALSDSQGWLTPEPKMLRNSSGRCTSKLLQTLWSGIFWYDFCTMVESDL